MRRPLATPLEWLWELQPPTEHQKQEGLLSKANPQSSLFNVWRETPHLLQLVVRFKKLYRPGPTLHAHIIPAKLSGNSCNISQQGLGLI